MPGSVPVEPDGSWTTGLQVRPDDLAVGETVVVVNSLTSMVYGPYNIISVEEVPEGRTFRRKQAGSSQTYDVDCRWIVSLQVMSPMGARIGMPWRKAAEILGVDGTSRVNFRDVKVDICALHALVEELFRGNSDYGQAEDVRTYIEQIARQRREAEEGDSWFVDMVDLYNGESD